MAQRQEVGIAIGQYQGRGQGENAAPEPEIEPKSLDAYSDSEDDTEEDTESKPPSSKLPLLFLFDVETTGLVVYNDFIIDIAAKVIDRPSIGRDTAYVPVPCQNQQDYSKQR